ncbi:hypothetical protein [Ornithinimicrobium ciconiae]|uniref:hypothetical protein n=1 Tax=Ornithinimicrobium ciconiae TaxID=2594265 RepID=UPI0013FD07D7|nr:hypothetical protein [Ornithinimicrobium ciconiae]
MLLAVRGELAGGGRWQQSDGGRLPTQDPGDSYLVCVDRVDDRVRDRRVEFTR